MILKIKNPIVSVDWLFKNLNNENLIIFDATIAKVTAKKEAVSSDKKLQLKGGLFFDIQKSFSEKNAPFPNTVLSAKKFEEKVQELGVNVNSCIVVYDDLGIYSSPRVWWMFQLMGFTNIAVLNGGFPAWELKKYPTEKTVRRQIKKGNFIANYQSEKIKFTADVLYAIESESILIADARSKGRFLATEPEPRSDIKGGRIPNSVSLPYSEIVEYNLLKSEEDLKTVFNSLNPKNKDLIFSCGSGITASVLALGAEIAGVKNHAVYDGSWTEWGSTKGLPIEK
ncbi:thiosulfate/3-mercaptopyruvate sulfurtransferase [Polaribacter sp. KT25b]|uniref:sulfurtransferase n=1 Tax=Polaribacter sp. KT25b TaxID=1855336 RepID=UPI00087961DC|nr:sulfurtransferase [Polaribacter sp. KT25b]SDR91335.1 thiosulfate/3-mercaptopyruvate sulfurtransferase [Polaribacter sp. KT25b]